MNRMPFEKYRPFPQVNLKDRRWPSKIIEKAPLWCSVDLRDGNQALINPMGVSKKLKMFEELVRIGFQEIEIGFPAASETEREFCRLLIEKHDISNLWVQVLCQARQELIEKTMEALDGVPNVIFHLYNSTSTLQRKVVFKMNRQEIINVAVEGTRHVKALRQDLNCQNFRYQYSPESFSGTELDFSVEICEAVMDAWEPELDEKIIFNLPATVEMSTPNIYADQIEWFRTHVKNRKNIILSVHPHNDRGCAVAATELALLAGADRVEGTLFGNGERTGNVDIVTLACNLYSQGVDPKLDFTDINRVIQIAEESTEIGVNLRHPYAGELVYTAFSGSHQDAIKKGMEFQRNSDDFFWAVPYLPIDPADLGRSYEAIIRVNSQSGKGGTAYLLQENYGYRLPRLFQVELSQIVQKGTEETGREIKHGEIRDIFENRYLNIRQPINILDFKISTQNTSEVLCEFILKIKEETVSLEGRGNGPIDALVRKIKEYFNIRFTIMDYVEHTLGKGADAKAVSYICIAGEREDGNFFGAGTNYNTVTASYLALLGAVNQYLEYKDRLLS